MPIFFPRSIGPVFIDVVVEESATAAMEIPSHPVERGAKISDHAWRLPTTLKMTNITQDVTGPWRALNDIMALAEPFDILNGFDLFPNMMIESIEPQRDVIWANVLFFTVSLKEVIIVETAESAGNAGTGGDPRGQGKTARGQVQARKVDTASGRGAKVKAELRASSGTAVA